MNLMPGFSALRNELQYIPISGLCGECGECGVSLCGECGVPLCGKCGVPLCGQCVASGDVNQSCLHIC